jgi:ribosomal protein S18 acetylase RimI-like enzyme
MAVADINLKDKIESHVGVFGITVAKEFRNQGIGKLLMNLVFKEAQKKIPSLKIVTLGVFANNPIAKEMYKKFGFVEYGKLPKGLVHKNQFIDHVFMFKKL